MRRALAGGAGLCAAAALACAPAAPRSGLTLLFLRRSPAASLGGLSWAPDPDHSRLVALDGRLRVARSFTSPRLANPVAVAALGGALLVTERTGERSEERRVGKECRARWSPRHQKKKRRSSLEPPHMPKPGNDTRLRSGRGAD